MACMPPAMELENRVLAMLGTTTAYKIKGNVLSLLVGTKTLAEFKSANR
jgi:heat shock protein HslJ